MTVENLRKAAEEAKFSAYIARRGDNEVSIMRAAAAADSLRAMLTPERVLALCELARIMDDTHLIAKQSPDWPGERFLNGTDEGTMALEALAAIEAAFTEKSDDT